MYKTDEIAGLEHLTGRAVVYFEKNFRASYLTDKYADKLIIHEIKSTKINVADFPGYDSTILSYDLLSLIIRERIPSWMSALENVSGVYIITDVSTGKHYVGSACGEGGLWARFMQYCSNGHGGNRRLKELLETQGKEYVKNFQYSIAEVFGNKIEGERISQRESHWKKVLQTREFGYNDN